MREEKKTNITASQAIQIAKEYQKKHNIYGVIHEDIERSVRFYSEFYRIKGSAWLVLADITPKKYEGDDEITFVISDEEGVVDHVLDHNGIPHRYHLSSNRDYTDEEFEAIFNDDEIE
ncbi:hypothetical protein WJ0W_002177 [Paenibacillus melissococcoides]|uniref:Uncharacterized protein n=1 Tax=Paenibacillus melissococcoides TaxID=2912268 RepID=A0ABM9G162_9BACL|nr:MULTISPECIES: hypothetical protein [Paenibacillus]MEB9895433.1 hypothetical protein [Bacillus cereus]CAH8244947.1 hypothetical protein WJ0W_002177 [Paenibacillus melissococcoides]CAH8709449.1 hypothetical protein WDD9_002259 [Paenibacillus melissococcoides]CAH8710177.1 hypothetical protein HTL2_002546 [Paenibacillus melissococcoides]